MGFPVTAKYFLRFRHSDTGLTPSFTYFKRIDTMAPVTPPDIDEIGGGTYIFEWSYSDPSSPDIVFEVDGGASIPTEEMRYISDTISPRDYFIDGPITGVGTAMWEDTGSYMPGTKGYVLDSIGTSSDDSTDATVFGKILKAREVVRGDTAGTTDGKSVKQVSTELGAGLTAVEGATFDTGTDSLEAISNSLGTVASDVTDIKDKTDLLPDNLSDVLTRILGMMHENAVLSDTTFDGSNNLLTGLISLYEDADGAQTQNPSKLVASYDILAEYWSGTSNLKKYTVTLNP